MTFHRIAFKAVLRRQYFQPVWKHARVLPILKPANDPTQPSSYRPIGVLDTVGKLFQKILLTTVLREVNKRGLLGNEQFGVRSRRSKSLQLAGIVGRVNRNFDERRLTGAVFLDTAKASDTVWVKGLLYRQTILYFPSYLAETASSYPDRRPFETSFQSAVSRRSVMRAGVNQGGLVSPLLFSLYVHRPATSS
jgi:hypothetical protein